MREEADYCFVDEARAADVLDLVTRLLATDSRERISPGDALSHAALSKGLFRMFS